MFVRPTNLYPNWFIPIKPKLSDKMSFSMVSMALERVLNCDINYLLSSSM